MVGFIINIIDILFCRCIVFINKKWVLIKIIKSLGKLLEMFLKGFFFWDLYFIVFMNSFKVLLVIDLDIYELLKLDVFMELCLNNYF